MPLLKVLFALNMLSSNVTSAECQLLWNSSAALELAIPQARCQSSTASIHHVQGGMNAILCLGSPCSVHKHELYLLDSTGTRGWSHVQQLRCNFCCQEKTHWYVGTKDPVTDNMNSAGASHFLCSAVPQAGMGRYSNSSWGRDDPSEKSGIGFESICTALVQELKWGRIGGTLQRYQVTIISMKQQWAGKQQYPHLQ